VDILIGTKNEYKATEIASLLEGLRDLNIHYLAGLNLDLKIEEEQNTLKKNAEKKALEFSGFTDWYVLASDGGVDIPALGKKWDILKNQRTVGEDSTDLEKAQKLLELMKDLKEGNRYASYHLALALARKGKLIWSGEKVTDKGIIAEHLFNQEIPPYRWMGHLWYYPQFKKVFNQLSEEEKVKVRKQGESLKRSLQKKIREFL